MTDHTTGDDGSENNLSTRGTDVTYDIDEDEPPSEVVVRAVASLTNTSILDLAPLYDVIDPDHLDGLFGGPGDAGDVGERSVAFRFNGCQVTVTPDRVSVRDRNADDG